MFSFGIHLRSIRADAPTAEFTSLPLRNSHAPYQSPHDPKLPFRIAAPEQEAPGNQLKCGPRNWRTKIDLPLQEAAG